MLVNQGTLQLISSKFLLQIFAKPGSHAPHSPNPEPGSARDRGQPFGTNHQQRHHADDAKLPKANIEQGVLPTIRYWQILASG